MSDDASPASGLGGGTQPVRLEPGQILFGRFKLIAAPDREDSLVGQGGMGIIHLAEDTLLDRVVAIKIPPQNVICDADAKLDLLAETRRALALTHPNIVRIYDFHESAGDGLWGISMQYVPGTNLYDLRTEISLGSRTRVAFSVERIRPWVRQICEALVHAHEFAGLVHRDLNPKNIMLEARTAPDDELTREHILITDFGIAASIRHSIQRSGERDEPTMAGAGTLPYMPWEQIMGEPANTSNDIYALGATIYDLLTTRPPFFEGAATSILTQIERAIPPSLTERRRDLHLEMPEPIPPEWEEVVRDCLQKHASDRPASIREIADRLGFDLPPPNSGAPPAAATTGAGTNRGAGSGKSVVTSKRTHTSEQTTRSRHSHRTDSKRLSVVMFTDIVGSVALQQRLGTLAYTDFVEQHDRMIQAALSQAEDGEILSDTGDGFLLRFGEPSDAVDTALRLQFLAQRTLVEGKPLKIRIGIHLGVITELQERIGGEIRRVGMALNLAARVMDIASGGQILLTRAVFDDARQFVREHPMIDGYNDCPEVVWMVHGDFLFKGSSEPLAIFEAGAKNIAPLTSPEDGLKGKKVSGSGSEQIFPSLPPPPPGSDNQDGGGADLLESQREDFEKAQRELEAEIERLKDSESKRNQELKLKEELLAGERDRLAQLSDELAGRREEEARAREELHARAAEELREARARSEQLNTDLAAKKSAFEAELAHRAEEMKAAAEQRLRELEDREQEIVEREQRLAEQREPEPDPELEQQLEQLRRERDEFRLQTKTSEAQLEEERHEFLRLQEEEHRRVELQITQESALKEEIHAAALAQLEAALAEQEAEIDRQRRELELAEQQITEAAPVGGGPDPAGKKLVEGLKLEANRYANRIVQLNDDLQQLQRIQRRRLLAIAAMSVLIAIAVGTVSARIIWGFWPWKLFDSSVESQPSLVIEGLRRLEGERDWLGLLNATIPAAEELQGDAARSQQVVAYARQAELQLAEGPPGRPWESEPATIRDVLVRLGETGWALPPAHWFLTAKAQLVEVQRSPRLAGFSEAVSAYLTYLSRPAEDERTQELDHDLNLLLANLHDRLEAQDQDPILDEAAVLRSLMGLPSEASARIPLAELSIGRLEVREQLRQLPPPLSEILQSLDALAERDPDWRPELQPEIDAALLQLAKPDIPLPDPDLLVDLSRRWDESRLLTIALDRLESDDPAYERSLTGLWNEFFRNRDPEARRSLPGDTSAWIGRLAVGVPALSLSGVKQLEELSRMGNAKAKLFLVDHYLNPGIEPDQSTGDLAAWKGLAEEALAGGEMGALVQLGTIYWRLADSAPDSSDARPDRDSARAYLARARSECPRKTDRNTATVLLAGLLSEIGTDGPEQRREMAEVCFEAGLILSETDLPLAIRNWNKAKEADPNTTRDRLHTQLESTDTSGNSELKEALEQWWTPTEE